MLPSFSSVSFLEKIYQDTSRDRITEIFKLFLMKYI